MNAPVRIGLSVLLLSLLACGTLQVSIERTATPDAPGTSTAAALQVQNAELATKVALLNEVAVDATSIPAPAWISRSGPPLPPPLR